MSRTFIKNLKTQYAIFKDFRKKRRLKYRHRKDKEWWLRFRMMAYMGAFGFGYFLILAVVLGYAGFTTLSRIFFGLAVFSPLLGSYLFDILEFISERTFAQIFWPGGGRTARAHSKGESMVHHEQFEDAINWFASVIMADPTDWQAQWRIVEILEEFLDDPERLAEERNRLLKAEGVPEGLWAQTAMNLGEEWVKLGCPEKAINTYKGLLWRMAEGPDADEVRRRLAELKAL